MPIDEPANMGNPRDPKTNTAARRPGCGHPAPFEWNEPVGSGKSWLGPCWCALLIALALTSGGCGGDAESLRPTGGHLFDQVPALVELPDAVLPQQLLAALAQEEVQIVGETVRTRAWRLVERTGADLLVRAPTRFPYRGAPRLVLRAEANEGETGRALGSDEHPVPGPDEILLAEGGVEVVHPQAERRVAPIPISYSAPAAPVLEALVGRRPSSELFEAPMTLEFPDEARRVAYAPAPSRVLWREITVPADGQLLFGLGLLQLRYRLQPGGIEVGWPEGKGWEARGRFRFRIAVDRGDGAPKVLFERVLEGAKADHFLDERIDLAAYAEQKIELTFTTEALSPSANAHLLPFWSEPTLDAPIEDDRPNVLVLLLDTVRADRIGCYGGERGNTPNIDALAERGMRFSDAMSPAPFTKTSHASMFSSLYTTQLDLGDDKRLAEGVLTLAETLRAAGYQTHAVTEGVFAHHRWGFSQGFDTFTVTPLDIEQTFTEATERMKTIRGRFFAFVQTYQAHTPYDPPDEERRRFVRPYDGPLPEVVLEDSYRPLGDQLNEADTRYMRDLYDGEIAYTDQWVGRFITSMEQAGLLENTLVILTSDHGEEFMDHGAFGHSHTLFQELLHVPLIVYQKGRFEGGVVVERPVHGVDLGPSILDAVGLEIPAQWVGAPYWSAEGATDRPLLSSHESRRLQKAMVALRSGRIKIIRYHELADGADSETVTVFDLDSDPAESIDLSETGRAPGAAQHVERELRRYQPFESGSEPVQISSELADALRDLGYAGDD